MANSMSEYRQNGVDYIIDDPTVAPVFVNSTAYTAGQYVKHQGNLYKFTKDHAAGAWNASHVEQVTVGSEIVNQKAAVEAEATARQTGDAAVLAQLAPEFAEGTAYTAGQYVTYQGVVYRLTADHAAGTTWANTQKAVTNLGQETSDLNRALSKIPEGLEGTQEAIGALKERDQIRNMFFPVGITADIMDLADENGNVLAKFDHKGALQTKEFDTDKTPQIMPDYARYPYDFAIRDEAGNIVFGINKGLAITNQKLYGKKISFVGDSITTYSGWIPEGYATFYPRGDVNDVEKTWWKKLINELGLKLIVNASWSGSRVSGAVDGSAYAACSDARIADIVGNSTETPDIIICSIGSNDWAHNVPIGSFDSHSEIPTGTTMSTISDAYALMLYKIRTTYPKAYVYCVLEPEGRYSTYVSEDNSFPVMNANGETFHDMNHAIREIAHIFGCPVIDLQTTGISFWNFSDYTVDVHLHFNDKGTTLFKDCAKHVLLNTYNELN